MQSSINRNAAAGLGLLIAIAALSSMPPAIAQTPAVPAVHVQRDYALEQRVWPVDLNRDGITDLVSTAPTSGNLQVSIGKGNGTFNAPVESSFRGIVLGTGDFNGDQRQDVIAARFTPQSVEYAIVPGTGTAALGAGVVVVTASAFPEFAFALSADFDNDGKRDLVLPTAVNPGIAVYPGNGDFTFDAPIGLVTGGGPVEGIVADLNNDGRRDLIIANGEGGMLSLFLNTGSFLFSSSEIPLGHQLNDVTVADVNRDGRLDLLVAAGSPNSGSGPGEGFVIVLRGNGNGTFGAPAEYPVLTGPMQIVAGDFNRDGLVDVATGNRSPITRDDCALFYKTWDSVSVATGLANGTFAAARHFSVGDQSLMDPLNPQTHRYRNTLVSLNTSDLNRDGATDLIASYGAILLNVAAVPNRPPVADFGPDATVVNTHEIVLYPAASDPDDDVLEYEIRDAAGTLISTYPNACYTGLHDGDNALTVTVDDSHGGSDSDTVVYTVVTNGGESGQFATGSDVGNVGATGSDFYNAATGTYTVNGSGSDIWGTADEFHYLWTSSSGNFEITTLVDSVQNVNAWTKAGLMIRENVNAGSRHASLFVSPGKGVAFQRRPAANGISVHTPGPATTAPVWLKLQRKGDVITAYYRKAITDFWAMVDRQTLTNLPTTVLVGLAVGSHTDGVVASASFSRVAIQGVLPLTGRAVGAGSGSVTTDGVVFTTAGRGADIWGAADAFYFVAMTWPNDVTITARVRSIANTHAWSKAGVMIREDLTAGSRHVMALVSPGKGVAMQYRSTPGAASLQAANVPGAAPAWVRLRIAITSSPTRSGTFTSSWSSDGEHWTTLGSVTMPFPASEFYIGLPVTSHNATASTSAVFDDVVVVTP